MGCRLHHKKIGARKRCSDYYQTEEGKKTKKIHNRRRYELKDTLPGQPNSDVEEIKDKDFMGHLDFMISLTEGRRVGPSRIKQIYQIFFQNWRQQGLEFWQKWCKLPEQSALVDQLNGTHGMRIKQIAHHLERSPAWVSVRLGMIQEMTTIVRKAVFSGQFPVRAYMYNLRTFTRVKKVPKKEIETFVQSVAGKSLSTRDIETLAYGYFHDKRR